MAAETGDSAQAEGGSDGGGKGAWEEKARAVGGSAKERQLARLLPVLFLVSSSLMPTACRYPLLLRDRRLLHHVRTGLFGVDLAALSIPLDATSAYSTSAAARPHLFFAKKLYLPLHPDSLCGFAASPRPRSPDPLWRTLCAHHLLPPNGLPILNPNWVPRLPNQHLNLQARPHMMVGEALRRDWLVVVSLVWSAHGGREGQGVAGGEDIGLGEGELAEGGAGGGEGAEGDNKEAADAMNRVIVMMRELFGEARVVVYDEHVPLLQAKELFSRAILFVGPTSPALSNLIFMPFNSTLIEILPRTVAMAAASIPVVGQQRAATWHFHLASRLGIHHFLSACDPSKVNWHSQEHCHVDEVYGTVTAMIQRQDGAAIPFRWGEFKQQNEMVREIVEDAGGLFMDVDPMMALRPDGHRGVVAKDKVDCLHYCLPGPCTHPRWLLRAKLGEALRLVDSLTGTDSQWEMEQRSWGGAGGGEAADAVWWGQDSQQRRGGAREWQGEGAQWQGEGEQWRQGEEAEAEWRRRSEERGMRGNGVEGRGRSGDGVEGFGFPPPGGGHPWVVVHSRGRGIRAGSFFGSGTIESIAAHVHASHSMVCNANPSHPFLPISPLFASLLSPFLPPRLLPSPLPLSALKAAWGLPVVGRVGLIIEIFGGMGSACGKPSGADHEIFDARAKRRPFPSTPPGFFPFPPSPLPSIHLPPPKAAWGVPVVDRVGLIIEIFGARANTREAKLQVEMAGLEYQRSRLVRQRGSVGGRLGFGSGGEQQVVSARGRAAGGRGFLAGAGESELQLQRRRIAEKQHKLKQQIAQVRRTRGLHRLARRRASWEGGGKGRGLPVVAVEGEIAACGGRGGV
ncbi:unnamed protein product [Closterium sp. Naga37s-1]|nr:unnamed protein product [Closterium sp. Naga37s-1]